MCPKQLPLGFKNQIIRFHFDLKTTIGGINILRVYKNRRRGKAACYVRNECIFAKRIHFLFENWNYFKEIFRFMSKPSTVGLVYRSPSEIYFLKTKAHFNKLDTTDKESYIHGDFGLQLQFNYVICNKYVFEKYIIIIGNVIS